MAKFNFLKCSLLMPLLASMTLSLGAVGSTSNGTPAQDLVYGKWRIVKVLGHSAITDMSERSARGMVGRRVFIGKDRFVFNGEVCEAPAYVRTREDTAVTLREKWHASAANLGLPDPVTAFDAGCTTIFAKSRGALVVPWSGYFFEIVPLRR